MAEAPGGGKVLAEGQPITEDVTDREVTSTEPVRLARLAGQPVRLRFALRNAKLYSFALRE